MNTCPNRGPVPGVVTVTADVPLCPSLVAVMVAEPTVTPVTRPLELTVATEVLLLDQVTVRPDSGFPFASLGVARSCTVCPTWIAAVAGLTLTEATATVETVMLAAPLCPSLVAVIVADPVVTPVTSPPPSTVAPGGVPLGQPHAPPGGGFA